MGNNLFEEKVINSFTSQINNGEKFSTPTQVAISPSYEQGELVANTLRNHFSHIKVNIEKIDFEKYSVLVQIV